MEKTKAKVEEDKQKQETTQQQNASDANGPTTAVRMTAKPAPKKLKITLKK